LKGLFEQVLAATDFEIFYTAMAKRNIMIQEQVLAMILAATGALPASFMRESGTDARGGRSALAADDHQEEEILRRVIQLVCDFYLRSVHARTLNRDQGRSKAFA
jgi:hypothetical protein